MASTLPAMSPVELAYTWEDFVALPEDDRRELIDGRLLDEDMPTEAHEHIVALLVYFLTAWARPRRAGRVYGSGYKVRLGHQRGVMPDLQFYRRDNLGVVGAQGVTEGRPDLAVEVISPSSARRDRVSKLNWYLELGVPEYWIVDPEAQTIERLALDDAGRYVIAESLGGDALFCPDSFEGLEIPLAELWAPPSDEPAAEG